MEEKKVTDVEVEENKATEVEEDQATEVEENQATEAEVEEKPADNSEENATQQESSPEEQRKNKYYKNIFLFVVLPIIVFIISILTGGFLLMIIALPFLVYGCVAWHRSCPECKGWNSLEEYDRDELGTYTEMHTETKRIEHKDSYKVGRYTGQYSEYKEDVPYEVTEYNVHYKCKICGALVDKKESTKRKI